MHLSVVLPTHNRAPVLKRAVASVLAQTHADFDLVIVDDGSRDDTPAVMATMTDPRIVRVRLDVNHGGNYARNRGIERATGDVISFLDSDDEFLPGKLAYVADFFARRPDVDVLLDSFVTLRPGRFGERTIPRDNPPIEDRETFRAALFEQRLHKSVSAISARRKALLEAGLFDETLFRRQDLEMLLRLSRAHRCVVVSDRLWIKHHTHQAVSARRDNVLEAVIAICERHPEYLTVERYRAGLIDDLRTHFRHVLRGGNVRQFMRDVARYRSWKGAPLSPLRLVLGGGPV